MVVNNIPIIPKLVRDVSLVIYEQMDGSSRYRMSMVSRDWYVYCTRILPIRNKHELKEVSLASDILRLLRNCSLFRVARVFDYACRYGNIELINILMRKGYRAWNYGFLGACRRGNVAIVQLTIDNVSDKIMQLGLYQAYKENHLGIIRFLSKLIIKIDLSHCLAGACKGGHIELVKDIIYNRGAYHIDWDNVLSCACEGGNIQIVQMIINECTIYHNWNSGLQGACRGGHILIMQFTIRLGATDLISGFYYACKRGHIALAQIMLPIIVNSEVSDRNEMNSMRCCLRYACLYGLWEIVQMVLEMGCYETSWSEILASAYKGGNLEIIRMIMSIIGKYDGKLPECEGYREDIKLLIQNWPNNKKD